MIICKPWNILTQPRFKETSASEWLCRKYVEPHYQGPGTESNYSGTEAVRAGIIKLPKPIRMHLEQQRQRQPTDINSAHTPKTCYQRYVSKVHDMINTPPSPGYQKYQDTRGILLKGLQACMSATGGSSIIAPHRHEIKERRQCVVLA